MNEHTNITGLPVVTIAGSDVCRISYKGEPVVTFAMVDEIHQRAEGTAKRNFAAIRHRLVDGVDYTLVPASQKDAFRTFGVSIPNRGLTVLTRRGILKAAPAVMVTGAASAAAASIPAEDPVLAVYRRWSEAKTGWSRLLDQDVKNEGTPEVRALMAAEDKAFWALTKMTPTSMAGVAALAHVLWDIDGPMMREGTAPYLEEIDEPKNRLMAAIWRAASGQAGLPSA